MGHAVWRHFALLSAMALLLPVLASASSLHERVPAGGWGVALHAALLYAPGGLLLLLPLAAGIAVGTAAARDGVAVALRVVVVTMALMLAVDVWAAPAGQRAALTAAREAGAEWPFPGDVERTRSPMDTLGGIRTGVAFLRGDIAGAGERLERYPRDHPRTTALDMTHRLALLLLPFIVTGVILGVSAWVRARVIFRRRRDATVAHWVLAWLLVPLTGLWVTSWATGMHHRVLFRQDPLWMSLVPYVPFVVVAALGWWAAAQLPAGDADAVPDHDAARAPR
jgi:hypothetical protein